MEQKQITTPHAPAAIGPYSQAIRYGQFIYTSGQIPLDPGTGEIVGEDVQAQTHRVLQNLQAYWKALELLSKVLLKQLSFSHR